MQPTHYVVVLVVVSLWISPSPVGAWQEPVARRAVIIGVDGLSPDGVRGSRTYAQVAPADGARRGHAPRPRSHAHGEQPQLGLDDYGSRSGTAGVTSNDWEPGKFSIRPTQAGRGGLFPTLCGVLRTQRPSARIACFHD